VENITKQPGSLIYRLPALILNDTQDIVGKNIEKR
jgi:hypothetical protein